MRTSNSSMGNHACKGRPAGKRGDTGAMRPGGVSHNTGSFVFAERPTGPEDVRRLTPFRWIYREVTSMGLSCPRLVAFSGKWNGLAGVANKISDRHFLAQAHSTSPEVLH